MHRYPSTPSALAPLLVLVSLASCAPGSTPETAETVEPSPSVPPADHHVHVWSRDALDALARIRAEVLEAEPRDLPYVDGDTILARLDSAGIRYGVLLSTAYFFGMPDLELPTDRAAERTRTENAWVADQARKAPGRLVAVFGVNPLAPYAMAELDHCAATPACAGMKLQLANSDMDFRSPEDVRRLRAFFAAADARRLALVVHLQTRRPDYGRREVDVFIDSVLPAAPDVPVQIAHFGGNSQYDDHARAAARAFLDALRDHPERTGNVIFDLAVVPLPVRLARGDSALEQRLRSMNRGFVEMARRVGFDRIVFGTDYPEIAPGDYVAGLRASLPLTGPELDDLLDDPAPYLPGRAQGAGSPEAPVRPASSSATPR